MSRIIDLSLTKALFNDEAKLLFDFTCIPVLSQVFCFVLEQKAYMSCK